MIFRDWEDAGRQLAAKLERYRDEHPIVIRPVEPRATCARGSVHAPRRSATEHVERLGAAHGDRTEEGAERRSRGIGPELGHTTRGG